MPRRVLSVLAGLLAGFAVVSAVQAILYARYPLPPGLEASDLDRLGDYLGSLPFNGFVLMWLSHALGAAVAGFTCVAMSRDMWRAGPIMLGVLLLAAGAVNLVMVPHPLLFAIVDVVSYLPASLLGGGIALQVFSSRRPTKAPVN